MSPPGTPQSKAASNGEAGGEGENQVAKKVSDDGKSLKTPTDTPNEISVGDSNGTKATSATSVDDDGPAPPKAGADQQAGIASATSNGPQTENRPTRSRTRSHSQSNNTDGKQNGGKRYRDEVSYHSN